MPDESACGTQLKQSEKQALGLYLLFISISLYYPKWKQKPRAAIWVCFDWHISRRAQINYEK